MTNFDALFAGCESFMESSTETDEGIYTSEGDALEAESVAEDVGTEGGEIAGEAETEDTKAEAANMVFDQLINMYMHVKQYGVDRTFLSLYNSNGELNRMISYRFPGIESIDSVGSPRSQASRAFIIAMEEDGIWKRIWTWIKETAVKVYNFFIKVMDWFREACGNLDMRVGKLYKYFDQSTDRPWSEIKDKTVKYANNNDLENYNNKVIKLGNELRVITHDFHAAGTIKTSGANLTEAIASATDSMAETMKKISAEIKQRSTATSASTKSYSGNVDYNKVGVTTYGDANFNNENRFNGNSTNPSAEPVSKDYYGRAKDKDDKDGVKALKEYLDRINKDLVDPLADAINDISYESDTLEQLLGNKDKIITHVPVMEKRSGLIEFLRSDARQYVQKGFETESGQRDNSVPNNIENKASIRVKAINMLDGCKDALQYMLKQKQAMDMMNLANKQAKQTAEQTSRLAGNGSQDYEAHKDAKLSMMGIVKGNSVFARVATLNEKIVAKCCTLAASLQSCVKSNGA